MIKVLKHGDITKKVKCAHCGALLSYEDKDVEIRKTDFDYSRAMVITRYITCPDCDMEIVLSSTK
jgi:DNA-directed RNA polymerase subunit RPC12/RpoP